MRYFPIPLGLVALVHLLATWGVPYWQWMLLAPGAVMILLIVRSVRELRQASAPLRAILREPFFALSAAVAAVMIPASTRPGAALVAWAIVCAASLVFYLFGVYDCCARRGHVDLVQVSWFAPALVAAMHAPSGVAQWVRVDLGWIGFAGLAIAMLLAVVDAALVAFDKNIRVPWFGFGAGAIMADWAIVHGQHPGARWLLYGLAVYAAVWLVVVEWRQGWSVKGVWSNLFSVCNIAGLAYLTGNTKLALAVTLVAVASLALELRDLLRDSAAGDDSDDGCGDGTVNRLKPESPADAGSASLQVLVGNQRAVGRGEAA